jgi:putative FmdB family regulatory protein
MPIYEYQCESCGHVEEALQRFSDQPLKVCKHCSGKLSKLISHSAFHLKGTGWYVTDYSGKANKHSSKSSEQSTPSGQAADKAPAENNKTTGND